jgi:hypothetical protein
MATTSISQGIAGALDLAIPSSAIVALANGGYAIGSAIDNRPTAGSVISYDLADFRLPITAATPTPNSFVTVWILPAIDGVTYASPNAAATAPPNLMKGTYQAVNISTTEIVITDIPLGPYLFKVLIQSYLGVPITASGNAQLQRRTLLSW